MTNSPYTYIKFSSDFARPPTGGIKYKFYKYRFKYKLVGKFDADLGSFDAALWSK